MQMQSSETKAGVTICAAPSMIAVSTSLPCSRCQLMFSIVTVASSTRMPTASASPPSVMMLSVSPSAQRIASAPRIESGIEIAMIDGRAPASEEDQDHQAGQRRRDDALVDDAADRRVDEQRLVADQRDLQVVRDDALELLDPVLDALDDGQRRDRAVLQAPASAPSGCPRHARCWSAAGCRRAPVRRRAHRRWRRSRSGSEDRRARRSPWARC